MLLEIFFILVSNSLPYVDPPAMVPYNGRLNEGRFLGTAEDIVKEYSIIYNSVFERFFIMPLAYWFIKKIIL